MSSTRPSTDAGKLKHALVELLGIAPNTYDDDDVTKALAYAGITRFNADLIGLTELDIMSLTIPGAQVQDTHRPLQTAMRRKLVILLAFYHAASRGRKGAISITTTTKQMYDSFRVGEYDPNKEIVPWNTPDAVSKNDELMQWKKTVRPSKGDYKEFRDEAQWTRTKERIITTLQAQGIAHLVQDGFVVTNTPLDEAQQAWLYKVFQDIMQAPTAKTIVTKHLATKDTRAVWAELCTHFDNSMCSTLHCARISSYLTSIRLHQTNWRGTQTSYVLHFKEQARQYNDMSPDEYTDGQLITFLNASVSGTPNLSQVLTLHRTAQRAAGLPPTLTFADYVSLLLEQTQVHDGANITTTNPRVKRQVNMTETEYGEDEYEYEAFQVHSHDMQVQVHDMDTPIHELQVNQMDTSNRRPPRSRAQRPRTQEVYMTAIAWKALSKEDQTAWDTVSSDGKKTILNSNSKGRQFPRGPPKPTPRQDVNQHEFINEDEPDNVLEAELHFQSDLRTLLGGTTTRSAPNNPNAQGFDPRAHTSQPRQQASTHELVRRSDCTPNEYAFECHAHERLDFGSKGPQPELDADFIGLDLDTDYDDNSNIGHGDTSGVAL